jgi:integrase
MLTVKKIESVLAKGQCRRHLDSMGLLLQVRGVGRASWVLRYVSPITHRTRELGLGAFGKVSLAEARAKAAEVRVQVSKGVDPIATMKKAAGGFFAAPGAQGSSITFGIAAERFWNTQQSRWRNHKVRTEWLSHLKNHTGRIWQLPINQLDQQLMVMVLSPIWTAKHVTARRIMHRVGQVLDFSRVMGWRTNLANPARFRGELEYALPKIANNNVRHLSAVPLDELPALMERLASTPGTAALAARFCILTASRPGEAVNATWAEIDVGAKVWTIPAARYKTSKLHQVPLSSAAMKLLAECPRIDGNEHVFISPVRPTAPICGMGVMALWKRMSIPYTLHGSSRANFSSYCHNHTNHDHTIIELALGHSQSAIVRAYWRAAPLDKLRAVFEDWGNYCTTQAVTAMAAE